MNESAASVTTVVRGFGYGITHVVTVPAVLFQEASWLGSRFSGIERPVAARCTRQVRSVQSMVVVMQSGTPVKCRECVRWTGMEAQTVNSYLAAQPCRCHPHRDDICQACTARSAVSA